MPSRSPLQDFLQVTLEAVEGFWQKLRYLAELRASRKEGGYSHWGLAQRYGQDASERAVTSAHAQLFLNVLRAPLRELLDDIRIAASPQGRSAGQYSEDLWKDRDALLPEDLAGGSAAHFESVLDDLRAIAESKETASKSADPPDSKPSR